jgi:hypothetical protein
VIEEWLGACKSADPSMATLAKFRIEAGTGATLTPLSEVYDTSVLTVRKHIYVPVYLVARWLLVHWWRLRWEPQRNTQEWRLAHSMASIGEGYVWPPVEFSSDGEFIQINMQAEPAPDVAAIRYLRDLTIDIPAAAFETAVDDLLSKVLERLSACGHADGELKDLLSELEEERSDCAVSRACRLQAHAGIDAGAAPQGWLREAETLSQTTGPTAIDEVMAVLPELQDDIQIARSQLDRIRTSPNTIDLSRIEGVRAGGNLLSLRISEPPWQRGERLARELRKHCQLPNGPITDRSLGDLLGVHLPLQAPTSSFRQPLRGGYRNRNVNSSISILVHSPRPDSQRFYLARLLGCALLSSAEEHLLPVTDAKTAMQKSERAFAQEFLCPWVELDEFTDEHGLDEEGLAEAADHFKVSEQVVLTTLVNKKKLPRHWIE